MTPPVPMTPVSLPDSVRDEIEVSGYVTMQGLVFRVRASGDFLAVLKKVHSDGKVSLVEMPVTFGGLDAAGKLIVLGVKEGLTLLTNDEFKRHLVDMITLAKSLAETVIPMVASAIGK